MRKIVLSVMMASILVFMFGCGSGEEQASSSNGESDNQSNEQSPEDSENKDQTITFGVTPWTSTVPPTEIAALILEDMGYTVEQTKADVGGVFMGLSRGDLDVFMDSWFPMHQKYMDKFGDKLDDTAVSYPEAKTGWVVPAYMEDINSIEDLKGKEDMFNNKMYGIEKGASATKESNELIKAYGLDIKQVNSSEGGMMAQATRQIKQEKPVLFFGWRPHTMFNKYDLKILSNEKGFFETSSVHVVTNSKLQERAPEAYEFLSNWSISIDDVEEMIVKIENEDMDPKKVAQEWIDNHQDKVNKMMGK
ncbi:glycine/betaine ABC transporter substrate-binding protein [Pontibacillus yanchengensis]|uniref:Glycine/betaine ABC transporter substrate-binding protein n=2 Tax=Pontibacillus yanchengensis TaxID=462910 RepID=A0ACC7VGR3_9BACI|nr:glycine betaine ABC transporter substrate-binding protein [Pontibacillus yanchengensis]MYL34322.1 glycine/betaine ABC transporter substrate-binding protein [Pontibacillus yanchengensis]MYL53790.1 glycine/betaine ABC transporter substrate-binding protein [Pontibacillus yanchengensis]